MAALLPLPDPPVESDAAIGDSDASTQSATPHDDGGQRPSPGTQLARQGAKPNGPRSQSGHAGPKRQWREAAVAWLESIALASHLCIDGDRATLRQGWRDGHHPWPPPRAKFAGIRWGSDHPANWAAPTKLFRTRSIDLANAVTGNTKVALLEMAGLLNERDHDHAGPTQEQVLAYERAELLVTAMEQAGSNSQPEYPVTPQPEVDWARVEADITDPNFQGQVRGVIARHLETGSPIASQILDGIRNRENHDKVMAGLLQILDDKGTDGATACRRWRCLTKWGLRQFASASQGGREVIHFQFAAMAESLSGNKDSPTSPELIWARATKDATQVLFPLARAAEFDTAGTKPIHVLIRDMDSALSGKEIDLHQPVADVELIVAEIEAQQARVKGDKQRPKRPKSGETPKGSHPKPEAIDAAAVATLKAVIEAGRSADTYFAPKRRTVAMSVSKDLGFNIGVATLFGTKKQGGKRVPRYPTFLGDWKQLMYAPKAPPSQRRNGKKLHVRDEEDDEQMQ